MKVDDIKEGVTPSPQ